MRALVIGRSPRNHLEAGDERHRLLAAVRLEIGDDDVEALLAERPGLGQHLVGLANAGGIAEKDLQATAPCGIAGHERCGKTRTSIPSAPSIKRSSGLPRQRASQSRRRLWPTKSWV